MKNTQLDIGFWLGIIIILSGILVIEIIKPTIFSWNIMNTGMIILFVFAYILTALFIGFSLPTCFSNLKKFIQKKKNL